jgi:hypothetical protein
MSVARKLKLIPNVVERKKVKPLDERADVHVTQGLNPMAEYLDKDKPYKIIIDFIKPYNESEIPDLQVVCLCEDQFTVDEIIDDHIAILYQNQRYKGWEVNATILHKRSEIQKLKLHNIRDTLIKNRTLN